MSAPPSVGTTEMATCTAPVALVGVAVIVGVPGAVGSGVAVIGVADGVLDAAESPMELIANARN